METITANPPAGFWRRLGAIVYDTLLVVALLAVVTFLFVPFLDGRVLVPDEVGVLAYVYRVIELAVVVAFFGSFWTRRGQTLGMLAWRLRLEQLDGGNVRWTVALKRLAILFVLLVPSFAGYALVWGDWPGGFARTLAIAVAFSPIVIAYAWVWVDRGGRTLHDRWSGTRVVVLPKKK